MMDFDAILGHIGHLGKYQLYVLLLASICQIFGGIHLNAGTFLTPTFKPNVRLHRCFVPNCDNTTTHFSEGFVNFAIPKVHDEEGNLGIDQCNRYKPVYGAYACTPESFTNETVPCSRYMWDHSEFELTAVSQFNIVCKKSWNGAASQSIFMGGVLLGSAGFGFLADRFGRKTIILGSSMLLLTSSIGTAFAPNFKVFSVLRFITATAVSGLFQSGFIIAVEFVGTSRRLWCANIMQIVFAVGELILGLVAYFIRVWRKLELVISIPAAVLLFYYWMMPESVRWLISKGKHTKAKQTVLKAARWNNKVVPDHLLQSAEYTVTPEGPEAELQENRSSPLSLFKTPQLRKWSLNLFLNWSVNAMVYYGLSLSAAHLSGNTYVNFAVLAAVEIPAVFLVTVALSYCSRRWVLCIVMVAGGLACGATVFVPVYLGWVSTTLAVIGKSAIAASFAVVYVYSAEIYPTVIRSTGIGMSSMFSRVGAIVAPIINELRKFYKPLPMIVFAAAAIIAGFLALSLPETHDRELPETIEEAERFAINRVNDVTNVPRSRLLGRFSSSNPRRLAEETRSLISNMA